MRLTPDELDPDWHRYPDTVLHFHERNGVRIDLREPIGKDEIMALRGIGLTGPFAVLTAHDPRGRDESREVNERRATLLEARLALLGASFARVDACSPDGSHCEASVAVPVDREIAEGLAREFEQVALFWFDGEKFWIVGALVGGDPVILPRVA